MPKKKVVLPSSSKKNQKMKKAGQRLMFLLSPAKTLNFAKTERPNLSFSNPALLNEVDPLVIALKGMSKGKLKSLLKNLLYLKKILIISIQIHQKVGVHIGYLMLEIIIK